MTMTFEKFAYFFIIKISRYIEFFYLPEVVSRGSDTQLQVGRTDSEI